MKRTILTILAGLVLATGLGSTPARAGVEIEIFPPNFFIATARPVYYEGHAAYWYRNRWYYRDGRSWRYYHEEPHYLHDWRGHHEYERYHYERHDWDRRHDRDDDDRWRR